MSNERAEKDMQIRVQPSLFEEFKKSCENNYKKVSEVIRELMLEYIRRENGKNKRGTA